MLLDPQFHLSNHPDTQLLAHCKRNLSLVTSTTQVQIFKAQILQPLYRLHNIHAISNQMSYGQTAISSQPWC